MGYIIYVNGSASFRWSFCPHSEWGSKELATILTTHLSMIILVMLETKSTQDALITKMEKISNVPRQISIYNHARISINARISFCVILIYHLWILKLKKVGTRKRSKYSWIARLHVVWRKYFRRIHVDKNISPISSCCRTRMARGNG